MRRGADGTLEILAAGLGLTEPAVAAGTGAGADDPPARTVLPVQVLILAGGESVALAPVFPALAPWIPGRYLVRVSLPSGITAGEVALRAGEEVSAPATVLIGPTVNR